MDKSKEYVGDVDIALYLVLKDDTRSHIEQSLSQYDRDQQMGKTKKLPFVEMLYYGKEKTRRFIKRNKAVIDNG